MLKMFDDVAQKLTEMGPCEKSSPVEKKKVVSTLEFPIKIQNRISKSIQSCKLSIDFQHFLSSENDEKQKIDEFLLRGRRWKVVSGL